MKISIITATYNSAKTVKDTLESALRQSYNDFEYLIIDGASKDDTMTIVKEYEPRFEGRLRYISEPDKGLYDAMNKAIVHSTGDWIIILNSGDVFYSRQSLSLAMKSSIDKVDVIYGDSVEDNNGYKKRKFANHRA